MSSIQVGAVLRHIRQLAPAPKGPDLPDHQLLQTFAQQRDEAAFAALLHRHGPMVLSVCRHVLRDAHDAEDAFQAVFHLLSRKANSIHRAEAVSGWLYRVAYHVAVRAKANAARRRVLEKRAVPMLSADPVLDLSLRELRAVLLEELEGLPEKFRGPLVLCGLEEKSLAEAAHLLGWTLGTVKGRLQRGRQLLRIRMRRRGLEIPALLSATGLAFLSSSGQVSAALADATLRSIVQPVAGGAVSAEVAALVQGASKSLFTRKIRWITFLLLALSVAAGAFGVVWHRAAAADPPPPQQISTQQGLAQAKPEGEAAVEVHGRVLDPEGKPIAGAKLYLAGSKAEQATSGTDGRFQFATDRPARERVASAGSPLQVMAVAEGYGCDWNTVPSNAEMMLRLVKDVPISGRILDSDGQPVGGARIGVSAVYAPRGEDLGSYLEAFRKGQGEDFAKVWKGPLPGPNAVATTAADGRFRLTGVGRERIVHLHLEGSAIATIDQLRVLTRVTETVPGPGKSTLHGASFDYVAMASRTIRGVVRDKETGLPVAGVSVRHLPDQGSNSVTDKEGRYELRGLAKAPGYLLHLTPADGTWFQIRVRLGDTLGLAPLTADFALVRRLTVRGKVTDEDGMPIAQARVDYHALRGNPHVEKMPDAGRAEGNNGGQPEIGWQPHSETTTGPDGSYTLTVLPGPGVIGVRASRPEAYMPAFVSLKERKAYFRTPVNEPQSEDHLTVATGGRGLGSITQSSYNALVLLEPGRMGETLVKDATLERPRERKGRVFGPDGQALTGVTVVGLTLEGIETLQEADFTVRNVNPRANRNLVFFHKDKNLGFFLKDLHGNPSEPVTVRLQPCGSASGRIVDEDGKPLASLRLSVQGRALPTLGEEGGGFQLVTADKDGRFRVDGLIPGQPYLVSEAVNYTGRLRISTPVLVEPGKHQDLGDIKARPGK
jgi:RNA polymerase sigma factor (sigma-70 family)